MFAEEGNYMCTFIDSALWVCGFASNANWIRGAQFPGVMPIKAMHGFAGPSVIVIDGSGALWHCGLPTGAWVQDIPQPPFAFREFMGTGYDSNDY